MNLPPSETRGLRRGFFRAALALFVSLPAILHGASTGAAKPSPKNPEAALELGRKLNVAILEGKRERAMSLLRKGASPDRVGELEPPLQAAVRRGDPEIFRKLLEMGAKVDVDVLDDEIAPGRPSLHEFLPGSRIPLLFVAAASPDPLYAKELLVRGSDPRETVGGRSALWVASRQDRAEVFDVLLEAMGGEIGDGLASAAKVASRHGSFSILGRLASRSVPPDRDSLCRGLVGAIEAGDGPAAAGFLAHRAPVDAERSPPRELPLVKAMERDWPEMFDTLLGRGARLDTRNDRGETPVLSASRWRDSTWLRILLAKGGDPRAVDSQGRSPLHVASRENVRLLLAYRADTNGADREGLTPLMRACKDSRWEVAKILLDAGAEVDRISGKGETALGLAVSARRFDVARRIVERGGGLDEATSGVSAILLAVLAQRDGRASLREIEWLLRNGADPSMEVSSGQKPWMQAARRKQWGRLGLLIRHGAKGDFRPFSYPLIRDAVEREDDTLLRILLESGCEIDRPDTALHFEFDPALPKHSPTREPVVIAMLRTHRNKGLEILLRHGADPDSRTSEGVPALLFSIALQDIHAVKSLLEAGADPGARDPDGNGVREYLEDFPYPQMADLFRARGG